MSGYDRDRYEDGAQMTYEIIGRWRVFGRGVPEFRFPPKDFALLADLGDVGMCLASNEPAKALVRQLLEEKKLRNLPENPTAMMLLVCLEKHGYKVKHVPLEELNLPGKLKRFANPRFQ